MPRNVCVESYEHGALQTSFGYSVLTLDLRFFFQDGLLSQGNQDLILKIFSKIPKMSPDGKRLQVISSTHLINLS